MCVLRGRGRQGENHKEGEMNISLSVSTRGSEIHMALKCKFRAPPSRFRISVAIEYITVFQKGIMFVLT